MKNKQDDQMKADHACFKVTFKNAGIRDTETGRPVKIKKAYFELEGDMNDFFSKHPQFKDNVKAIKNVCK